MGFKLGKIQYKHVSDHILSQKNSVRTFTNKENDYFSSFLKKKIKVAFQQNLRSGIWEVNTFFIKIQPKTRR
jgi:hypothetical protein